MKLSAQSFLVNLTIAALLTLLLSACDGPANNQTQQQTPVTEPGISTAVDDNQRLAEFFEQIFERDVSQSPQMQAILGRKTEDYGRWDDYSDEYAVSRNQQRVADLDRLHTEFDFATLDTSAKVSYRIFEYNQQRALTNFKWRHHDYAISQMNSIATALPTFLQNVHRVDNRGDAEAYIARLAGLEQVMQETVRKLRQRESLGVIPPMMVYDRVLPGTQNMLAGAPFEESLEDGVLLSDFRGKVAALAIDDEDKEILINEASNALSGPFRRGYQALIKELQRLKTKADNNHGIWNLPEGDAYYANRIENWTTIAKPAAELHQLGLSEVARIRAEMEHIKVEVGFDGDLGDFFQYVRNNPNNYYPNTDAGREEYLKEARALIDGLYDIADDYFNVLPKAPLEVRRVEPWREDASSTAFYNRPSPDGSRPGIFYVNMKDMGAVQKHIMNSLAYHEGAPGHHFQIAIQQELTGVPKFRKFGGYSAYSEGWALYTERLAFEAGLYEGLPMRNFGRLSEEMKRAVRLVVDTGMHSMQWSREQCIEYMTANTPMAPADIVRQIERYFVFPGQALSYKVGMLKLLELRQRAEDQLGEAYDIRDFHDTVLKNGAVPMPVLEELVDAYISKKGSD